MVTPYKTTARYHNQNITNDKVKLQNIPITAPTALMPPSATA